MRALVIAASILLAPVAASAADAPSPNTALAKQVMSLVGGTDAARASVPVLAGTMAVNFANGARNADVAINQKVLDRTVRAQVKTFRPLFINAGVQAYATVYTAAELRQLITYYKRSEAKRGKLPKSVIDKASALGERQAANTAPLWPKLNRDLFAAYCAKTVCNDNTHKLITAFGHT